MALQYSPPQKKGGGEQIRYSSFRLGERWRGFRIFGRQAGGGWEWREGDFSWRAEREVTRVASRVHGRCLQVELRAITQGGWMTKPDNHHGWSDTKGRLFPANICDWCQI